MSKLYESVKALEQNFNELGEALTVLVTCKCQTGLRTLDKHSEWQQTEIRSLKTELAIKTKNLRRQQRPARQKPQAKPVQSPLTDFLKKPDRESPRFK